MVKRVRHHRDNPEEIYPFFFWKRCECCGEEYRREPMWEARGMDSIGQWHSVIYCKTCAPTPVDAMQRLKDAPWVRMPVCHEPRRPGPPAAPPMPPRER